MLMPSHKLRNLFFFFFSTNLVGLSGKIEQKRMKMKAEASFNDVKVKVMSDQTSACLITSLTKTHCG